MELWVQNVLSPLLHHYIYGGFLIKKILDININFNVWVETGNFEKNVKVSDHWIISLPTSRMKDETTISTSHIIKYEHISFVSKLFPLKPNEIKRLCFVYAFIDLSWLCLCVCASSLSSRATECFSALISLLQTTPRSLDPARRPKGDRNAKPKQCSSHPVSGPCLFVNKHLGSFTPHHSKLDQNISSSRCQAV